MSKTNRDPEIVYLISGSNLGDRSEHLRNAIEKAKERVGGLFVLSSIYETEPWGFRHETPFLNQVSGWYTRRSPHELLHELMTIEQESGRIRKEGEYAARSLDIDILFYGRDVISMGKLIIPHPRICERRFVLVPMDEIAPDFIHPVMNKSMRDLLKECQDSLWVRKFMGN